MPEDGEAVVVIPVAEPAGVVGMQRVAIAQVNVEFAHHAGRGYAGRTQDGTPGREGARVA